MLLLNCDQNVSDSKIIVDGYFTYTKQKQTERLNNSLGVNTKYQEKRLCLP